MQNCGRTVERALCGVEGVGNAVVDFEKSLAHVYGQASVQRLIWAVEGAGFTAVDVTAIPPETVLSVEGMMWYEIA
jgi:copper chaperone CopZ